MLRNSLLLAAVSGLTASAGAATVSINIVGGAGASGTLATTDVAGVVPAANWNNVIATAGVDNAATPLVDSTGAASGISVSWTNIGPYQINTGNSTPNHTMFNGYLDNFEGLRTVSFTGLNAGLTYSFYLYSDGDNGTNSRRGFFTMGGTTTVITDASGNFDGTFVEVPTGTTGVGNYTVFTLSGSSSYDLTFRGTLEDDLPRAALNGIQIVQVPEASTLLLGLLGLVPVIRRRR
ncbi:hypothetical protein OKA04_22155 [Luteolibacter flavescens]|uniref:PEP-CTERM sorting domain-containing protein n=1 Tax=Luteolibacter flavescens TaxID=1859460 RepID=A0ABT3FWS8_9BACT|nr:hypothetical protein [Luteolibacter flavescens]MCW1887455.1 hypothetical protein [Luteolibacter flavescens]